MKKIFFNQVRNNSESIQPESLLTYTASSGPWNLYWPPGNDFAYIIIGGRRNPAADTPHNKVICSVVPVV